MTLAQLKVPPTMLPRPWRVFFLGRLGLSEQAFVIKAILQSKGIRKEGKWENEGKRKEEK